MDEQRKQLQGRVASLLVAALGIAAVFFWHAEVIGMRDYLGLDLQMLLVSACFCTLVLGSLTVGLWAYRRSHAPAPGLRHLMGLFTLLAVVVGSGIAVAEALGAYDELAFQAEAKREAEAGARWYSRPRLWPNGNSGLVWQAESGFHAHD